jgi:hypothetical protein
MTLLAIHRLRVDGVEVGGGDIVKPGCLAGAGGIISSVGQPVTEFELSADDTIWLDERLREYAELLEYLREH